MENASAAFGAKSDAGDFDKGEGYHVGRKLVRRLMALMGWGLYNSLDAVNAAETMGPSARTTSP